MRRLPRLMSRPGLQLGAMSSARIVRSSRDLRAVLVEHATSRFFGTWCLTMLRTRKPARAVDGRLDEQARRSSRRRPSTAISSPLHLRQPPASTSPVILRSCAVWHQSRGASVPAPNRWRADHDDLLVDVTAPRSSRGSTCAQTEAPRRTLGHDVRERLVDGEVHADVWVLGKERVRIGLNTSV